MTVYVAAVLRVLSVHSRLEAAVEVRDMSATRPTDPETLRMAYSAERRLAQSFKLSLR